MEPGLQEIVWRQGHLPLHAVLSPPLWHCPASLCIYRGSVPQLQSCPKEYQDLQPKASQLRVEFLQQKLLSPGLSDQNQQAIHH